jgi:hypothetical protein
MHFISHDLFLLFYFLGSLSCCRLSSLSKSDSYLDLAEERAKRKIPMTMEDWAKRLDLFLEFDERDILRDGGKITAKIAKEYALSEFEKYRIVQDRPRACHECTLFPTIYFSCFISLDLCLVVD